MIVFVFSLQPCLLDSHLNDRQRLKKNNNNKGKAILLQAWTGLKVPGGRGSQISRQSAHEGGKVVGSTHRPPSPPRIYSSYSFLLQAIGQLEGLCQ